jgi:tetratricopeptide (TPR) repeat protein
MGNQLFESITIPSGFRVISVVFLALVSAMFSVLETSSNVKGIDMAWSEDNEAEEYYEQGYNYYGQEHYHDAIDAYKKAIAVKPDYWEAYDGMSVVYRYLEQWQEAIDACKKTISIKQDHPDAYLCMGNAYESLLQYQEAIDAYQEFVAIEPEGEEADLLLEAIKELRIKLD